MTQAPERDASNGTDAAGCTTPDVPTTSMTSQVWPSRKARLISDSGSASPNQTTSGRSRSPHCGQRGGFSGRPAKSARVKPVWRSERHL